jgi:hypothetical protein
MNWAWRATLGIVSMDRERRRRGVRALVAAGATWTAAFAGFTDAPSRFQLIMSVAAGLLVAGAAVAEPDAQAQHASPKKFVDRVGPTWMRAFAWAAAVGAAFKKTAEACIGKLGSGLLVGRGQMVGG